MKDKEGILFCGIFSYIRSNFNSVKLTVKQQTLVVTVFSNEKTNTDRLDAVFKGLIRTE